MSEGEEASRPQVGVETVAHVLGITSRRVQQLTKDEVFTKVGRGRYDLIACVHAYIAYWQDRALSRDEDPEEGTLDDARRRKTFAEAEIAEYELAEKRRNFVAVDEVEAMLTEPLTLVYATLKNLPARWGPMLVGCTTIQEAIARLKPAVAEIIDVLRDLGMQIVPESDADPDAVPK